MMNKKEKPCTDSPDYKYQNCIFGKILDHIGCQPYWLNISQTHKNCTKIGELRTFLETYKFMSYGSAKKINDYFRCLKPCTFIEYQVFEKKSLDLDKFSYVWTFQIAEQPIYFERPFVNDEENLQVYITFAMPTISVEKEVDAYPWTSFVADYGGLLGLFVGANFLGHFEFCLTLLHRLYSSKIFSKK